MDLIYLDNNATTRPADAVVEAMVESMRARWANPSSVHRFGQSARQSIDQARRKVADLIGCRPRELVFTGGGTESINLAIRGVLQSNPGRRVLVSSRLEHSAVRELCEHLEPDGVEIIWIACDDDGIVQPDRLDDLLRNRGDEVALVSLQWANNETGVINPVEQLATVCRRHGVLFHTDAVQWVGKMPTDIAPTAVDLLSCSAHKMHGPKGVGALYVRRGLRLTPQMIGGPHERSLRGGTEHVAGIVGMGVAAELAQGWLETDGPSRMAALRDDLERRLLERIDGAAVNGASAPRLWNTSSMAFAPLEAEAILLLLSERGLCASAGAACSSGSLDPSPVLLAMGVPPEQAHGSIRLSLSRETTESEVEAACEIVPAVVEKLRRSWIAAG